MGILLDKIQRLHPSGYQTKRKSNEIIRKHWPDIVEAKRRGYSARQITEILQEIEGHQVSEMSIFSNLKKEEMG